MLILLTSGDYSDYHLSDVMEWAGTVETWNAMHAAYVAERKKQGRDFRPRDWHEGFREWAMRHGARRREDLAEMHERSQAGGVRFS